MVRVLIKDILIIVKDFMEISHGKKTGKSY